MHDDKTIILNKKSLKTFIRMIVYPCLAIALVSALYFNPYVQTEYNLRFGSLEGKWKRVGGASEFKELLLKKDVYIALYGEFHRQTPIIIETFSKPFLIDSIVVGRWQRRGNRLIFDNRPEDDYQILSWTRDGMYMKSKDGVSYWQRVSDD